MSEVLIIFIAWFVGSAIWLLMQIAAHLLIVRTHEACKASRERAMVGMIGSPVIVFLFHFVEKLWGNEGTWTEVVVFPLAAGWLFVVALAGVCIAARLRGVLKEESAG